MLVIFSQVIGPVSRNPDCLCGSLVESGDVVLQAGGVGVRQSIIDDLRDSFECSCPSRRARILWVLVPPEHLFLFDHGARDDAGLE